MDLTTAQSWMLTGARGAGKTTFCRALAAHARAQGWQAAGLLSPGVFEGSRKIAILAEDVRSGTTRPLAALNPLTATDLALGPWYFSRSTLEWGNLLLEASLPCDLLIVDELGPLELVRQEGWHAALAVLRQEYYRLAMVVIRPELQEAARGQIAFRRTIEIDHSRTTDEWVQACWSEMRRSQA
ncbi:MAG: hypothetical protein JW726_19635 [Anaerolineales bacterium]|nr:hypothetical protein [Anaerolineales bacterium]